MFYLRAQTLVLTLDVSSQVLLVKGQDQDLVVSTLKVVVQVNDVLTVDKHFELLDLPHERLPRLRGIDFVVELQGPILAF